MKTVIHLTNGRTIDLDGGTETYHIGSTPGGTLIVENKKNPDDLHVWMKGTWEKVATMHKVQQE